MTKIKNRKIPSTTNFGSNLKYLRKLKGISQTKLAIAVGLNRNNIASYESGFVEPNGTNFLKICKFFDVDPIAFLQNDLVNEKILNNEDPTSEIKLIEMLALDQIEELSNKTHEMAKIVEGYQTFKEIHSSYFDQSMEINHMMLDTLKLFENLIDTNWKLINNVVNNDNIQDDSEE